MDNQNQLDFIKQVSAGWFNKNDSSFNFYTKPLKDGSTNVYMLLVNEKSTVGANYQRIQINYNTKDEYVDFSILLSPFGKSERVEVSKQEAVTYLSDLIQSPDWGEKPLNQEEGEVDFYNLLEQLQDQVFHKEDIFEINKWNSELYLHKQVGEEYNAMQNIYHVHGGVGNAPDYNGLHDITTTIELATSPTDGKTYLNVRRDLTENPLSIRGLYEDATPQMFVDSILEQYKGAWNRSK
ncbi:hypothetical protein [Bacillus toyonensis]|uniref:hypothetical protein n=1 Tax=Bacillus toyonensis TaxID=155322 RepID=UPI000BF363F8|nr:hypothetical protein [Bacillus toyonensis]PGF05297.1 hypothetical protein COM61_02485 [Bacillus toyonensis]